ncbi:hypothetical protein NKI13_24475 [Mesorhizobium australicum]|uniref:hypothetical protein n=1 Tax=Mesorhizobium australicum TaxID=536018 RepID=UPI00333918AC
MRLYFAHPVTDYGTKRQADAIAALKNHWAEQRRQPLEIENPDQPHHQAGYTNLGMDYFKSVVASCYSLAFMRFPNGAIGAGMGKEIMWAHVRNMQIYELFDGRIYQISDLPGPVLTVDETRALIASMTPTQPTATTTEVSEAASAVCDAFDVLSLSEAYGGSGATSVSSKDLSALDRAIKTLRAALSTAPSGDGVPGMVLVPREPTEAMHNAAWDACDNGMQKGKDWSAFNGRLWHAMLDAALSQRGTE